MKTGECPFKGFSHRNIGARVTSILAVGRGSQRILCDCPVGRGSWHLWIDTLLSSSRPNRLKYCSNAYNSSKNGFPRQKYVLPMVRKSSQLVKLAEIAWNASLKKTHKILDIVRLKKRNYIPNRSFIKEYIPNVLNIYLIGPASPGNIYRIIYTESRFRQTIYTERYIWYLL